jgi:CHAT domain-containing protein
MSPSRALPLLIVWLVLVTNLALADSRADRAAAVDLLGKGVSAFNFGDLVAATRHWSEAARLCHIAGAPHLEAEALARRGEALRVDGHFGEAAKDLTDALVLARSAGDARLAAASSGALGNLELLSRRTAKAEPLLLRSLSDARRLNDMALAAAAGNDLGNLYAATDRVAQAAQSYDDARQHAANAGDALMIAMVDTNAARLALEAKDEPRATVLLHDASGRLARMDASYPAGLALVAVGSTGAAEHRPTPSLRQVTTDALATAITVAERIGNKALLSAALGEQGRMALDAGKTAEASRLTQQALLRARQTMAPEIAFKWEWQQARIDRALDHDTAALGGYRSAIATLASVRKDFPNDYQKGRSSFREQFGALYLEFADLLLRQSRHDSAHAASLIREARDVAEQLKASELQDYFRDPCITSFEARQRGIETVAPGTAVLYPIVLPDRLELLVSAGGHDSQVTVPINEAELRREVLWFRRLLEQRTTNEFLQPAQHLYRLLVGPLESVLGAQRINTLVLVPDGILRSMPLAALHDGQHFLIERYAIATVPGLRLVDPQPLSPDARRMLAAGLSKSREGFPALPKVASELESIHRLENSTNLLDGSFLRQRFAHELHEVDYTMVHLASHSKIDTDPSRSFVLAFDGQLSLDDLEASIKLARFRELGLELLTLSACQTASGDDRAALGMAGLALKAGARSVLATLWVVNDEASGQLAVEFYRQLRDPALSKARALRAAQLSLIEDPLLGHPAYWAPFLLIGNWL